jgi:glycosyltransferase involved in cell wall biosynthesis
LRLAEWFRPLAPLGRAMRATRWSLYAQERINAAALLRPLNNAVAADGASLLYVQEYWGGRFDHLASRTHVPIVAADHGGVAQGVVKWFKRDTFRRAAALYCQTPDECSQVESFGSRATLQPNGCDISFFVPPPSGAPRERTIVTVARLTNKQKRTSDLIRALSLVADDWTLQIVGTGPDLDYLVSLAREVGVAPRVKFHGFKSQAEIRALNQQCGVFAMPSANEAVCLAALEAMSCGAAIVASRIRAFESLISDGVNGKLFPPGDVQALADAIEVAWSERDTLGAAARVTVAEHFNSRLLYQRLAKSIRQSASLSRELVASRSGRDHG